MYTDEQRILDEAIAAYEPHIIICLFSGGYDSMIATHMIHEYLDTHGIPMKVWSIDTCMAADGWVEYVTGIGEKYGWDHIVHRNEKGFEQFVTMVEHSGCPRTKSYHKHAFRRLKERSIDFAHMSHKQHVNDKTLFISGMRREESADREDADEYHRVTKSSKCFCAPIVKWAAEQCMVYRVENDLPENPFYETVKGSGDCQCNWGNFISLGTLELHSPNLAAGNVRRVHEISLQKHGYGWDGTKAGDSLIDIPNPQLRDEVMTTPFLCSACSRVKPAPPTIEEIETVMIQRGMF